MFQSTNNLNFSQAGFSGGIDNVALRQRAFRIFMKARSIAQRKKLTSAVFGRTRHLQHLDEKVLPANSHYAGTKVVNLDSIVGTESRGDEFDIDFMPLAEHVEQRWVSVAMALLNDVALPPVELIKVGQEHFVRDGHHRISVSRMLGYRSIDAIVIEYVV